MDLLDILIADAKKNYASMDPAKVIASFNSALHNPKVKVFKEGNSLVAIEDKGDGVGEFHFINADRLSDFAKNVIILLGKIKDLGYREAVTNFENPKVLEVAKMQPYEYSVTRGVVADKEQYILTVRF